jgi:transcriptional regulator with XRE-family HTH domain
VRTIVCGEVVCVPDKTPRDAWQSQRETLGAFIRERRTRANLSLRQLAELTSLSNPYLSQIERGLHQPSVRVLKAISDALNVSAETLLAQAGLIDAMAEARADQKTSGGGTAAAVTHPQQAVSGVEEAIRAEARLTEDQKTALISVYRTMLGPADLLH